MRKHSVHRYDTLHPVDSGQFHFKVPRHEERLLGGTCGNVYRILNLAFITARVIKSATEKC